MQATTADMITAVLAGTPMGAETRAAYVRCAEVVAAGGTLDLCKLTAIRTECRALMARRKFGA